MRYLVGIDGGGTRTTLALAAEDGTEIARRTGAPGLVDPRHPAAGAELLALLVREAIAAAGRPGPASALCAGLAGVGNAAERGIVEESLRRAEIAERVLVRSDGETALHGAPTRLLLTLLEILQLPEPEAIPPWAGRAEKAEVAALAVHALRLAAGGDGPARAVVREAAASLAAHAAALVSRLGLRGAPVAVVLHGGVAVDPTFAAAVRSELSALSAAFEIRPPAADAVTGAIHLARALAEVREW